MYTLIIALLNKLLATEIKRFLVLVTHYEKVTVSQILFSHSSCSWYVYQSYYLCLHLLKSSNVRNFLSVQHDLGANSFLSDPKEVLRWKSDASIAQYLWRLPCVNKINSNKRRPLWVCQSDISMSGFNLYAGSLLFNYFLFSLRDLYLFCFL